MLFSRASKPPIDRPLFLSAKSQFVAPEKIASVPKCRVGARRRTAA
jgi:hypothetical protein